MNEPIVDGEDRQGRHFLSARQKYGEGHSREKPPLVSESGIREDGLLLTEAVAAGKGAAGGWWVEDASEDLSDAQLRGGYWVFGEG